MMLKIVLLFLASVVLFAGGLIIGHLGKEEEVESLTAEKKDAVNSLNRIKVEIAGLQLQNIVLMDQVRELSEWHTGTPNRARIASVPAAIVDNSGLVHAAWWNGLNWVVEHHEISRDEVRCWRPFPEPPAR